jgi:hypothetical protein
MTKDTLLNESTEIVLEDSENKNRLLIGLVIMSIAVMICLGIYSSVSYTQIKLLKAKHYNDSVAIKSLEDNLLMPKIIANELELR